MNDAGRGALVRKILTATAKGIDRALRQVRFIASREEVDSDGEVVLISGIQWNLNDPTHERVKLKGDHGPNVIGTLLDIEQTILAGVPALLVLAQFLPEGVSAEADRIYAELQAGARDSWSMGFTVLEADSIPVLPGQTGRTYRRIELREISSVVLASNRGAVTLQKELDASPWIELPADMTPQDFIQLCQTVARRTVFETLDQLVRRSLARRGRGDPDRIVLELEDEPLRHITRAHGGAIVGSLPRRFGPNEIVLTLDGEARR